MTIRNVFLITATQKIIVKFCTVTTRWKFPIAFGHSQKLIGVLWHFNPFALVASYVAHDKVTQNINIGNSGGKIKL